MKDPTPIPADAFDAAGTRARVLAAWAATPARFREDANAEEDYALGAYRDRLVVELAQNAADAAVAAGAEGQLRLVLDTGELRAANTGAPLDAAGVESLSTLRASAKRDTPSVGRFGVGFAAVLSVTDEPRIRSRYGGVAWSRAATGEEAAAVPELAEELGRRGGHVPVLRLPFGCDEQPEPGYDTEVVLPLRDESARGHARSLLAEAGPALLLGLPALRTLRIEVDGVMRELRARWDADGSTVEIDDAGVATRWRLATAGGTADPHLLADRPTEERGRPSWHITWAAPLDHAGLPRQLPAGVTPVLHAPTPSDEPVGVPALLLASFPLDPSRRHVALGPLTDFLVGRAAEAYADLVSALPRDPAILDMVPGPVASGPLDGRVRQAVRDALPRRAFLPTASGGPPVQPADAAAAEVPTGLVEVLADVFGGLLPVGWTHQHTQLRLLGVRLLTLGEVVDMLGTLHREPGWWKRVYTELRSADTEPLAGLPVPLADGRTVSGPRGVLLPTGELDADALSALGVRVAAADAVDPLLVRLGATEATPRAVLDDPHVRAAVAGSLDAEDPDTVAAAVLPAVRASGVDDGDEPWLGALALRDADGEARPADELLIPGGPLHRVVSADAPFGVVSADLVDRWGVETLVRAGVLSTFAVVRDEDVTLDVDECDHDLDAEETWVEATLAAVGDRDEVPPVLVELTAVRDLDLVAADRWGEALALLAQPPLRAAVTEPAAVVSPDGRRTLVRPYTAWWLRSSPVLDGRRPGDLRVPEGDAVLSGLYEEAPADDPVLLAALGVRTTVSDLLAEPGGAAELLDRLADPDRRVDAADLDAIYAALAEVDEPSVTDLEPPRWVRVPRGTGTAVVPASDVVVLDSPDLLPLLGARMCLGVRRDRADRLAGVLDLSTASAAVAGRVESSGDVEPVPALVHAVLPAASGTYRAHDPLMVDGVSVEWRFTGGEVHAASLTGLARGLAWASGSWEQRHLLAALLEGSAAASELLTEAWLDIRGDRRP